MERRVFVSLILGTLGLRPKCDYDPPVYVTLGPRRQTKPYTFSKQLWWILYHDPNLTIKELSLRICRSERNVIDYLRLMTLDRKIGKMLDNGELKLSNCFLLSQRIPRSYHNEYLKAAKELDPIVFAKMVMSDHRRILYRIERLNPRIVLHAT